MTYRDAAKIEPYMQTERAPERCAVVSDNGFCQSINAIFDTRQAAEAYVTARASQTAHGPIWIA